MYKQCWYFIRYIGAIANAMKHIVLIMSLIIVLMLIYIIETEKDCASAQPFFIKKEARHQ